MDPRIGFFENMNILAFFSNIFLRFTFCVSLSPVVWTCFFEKRSKNGQKAMIMIHEIKSL